MEFSEILEIDFSDRGGSPRPMLLTASSTSWPSARTPMTMSSETRSELLLPINKFFCHAVQIGQIPAAHNRSTPNQPGPTPNWIPPIRDETNFIIRLAITSNRVSSKNTSMYTGQSHAAQGTFLTQDPATRT